MSDSTFTAPVSGQHCLNHPGVPAAHPCSRCGGAFCESCTVSLQGRTLCAGCKELALRELQRRGEGEAARSANDAFKYSLIGILCLGIVLEPLALYKGIKSLQAYKSEADQSDRWKAVTAVVIASVILTINILWLVATLVLPMLGS